METLAQQQMHKKDLNFTANWTDVTAADYFTNVTALLADITANNYNNNNNNNSINNNGDTAAAAAESSNNSSAPSSPSTSRAVSELNEVTMWLMVYVIPVIFSFGIFGNCVSFVVFLSEKMRRVSTNIYLAALSASNGVFLVAVGVSWTDVVGLKLMHRQGVCQASVYLTYCSGFVSVWLVVCITVENFVINFFLHKASQHCTVRRALSFVVLLCVSGFLLYDFAIWTTGVLAAFNNNSSSSSSQSQYCTAYPEYQSIVEMFTLVDIIVTLIVPTVVILALVVPTCIKNLSWCGSRGRTASSARVMLSRKERALLRVTRLLCVIIVSFVLLTAPSHLNKLRHLFFGGRRGAQQAAGSTDMFIVFICQVFYHLSFSVNFVYFLVWGKNFRERFCHLFVALYKVVCRCRRKLLLTDY